MPHFLVICFCLPTTAIMLPCSLLHFITCVFLVFIFSHASLHSAFGSLFEVHVGHGWLVGLHLRTWDESHIRRLPLFHLYLIAIKSRFLKTSSMAAVKNLGEIGSHCLTPLRIVLGIGCGTPEMNLHSGFCIALMRQMYFTWLMLKAVERRRPSHGPQNLGRYQSDTPLPFQLFGSRCVERMMDANYSTRVKAPAATSSDRSDP